MRRVAGYLRATVALAAATAIAAVVAPVPASASHPIVAIKFSADSGDSCRYGATEGYLSWRGVHTAVEPAAVDIAGKLTDKPATASDIACRDDGYYSVASFDGYAGRTVVDKRSVRADNGVVEFSFALGERATTARIDSVVIQVCRHSLSGTGRSYCGPAKTYPRPAS